MKAQKHNGSRNESPKTYFSGMKSKTWDQGVKSKKTLNPGEKYKKTWDPGMNTKQKPRIQKWKQNKNLESRGENKKPILQGWKPKNLWFRVESQKTFHSGLKAKKQKSRI